MFSTFPPKHKMFAFYAVAAVVFVCVCVLFYPRRKIHDARNGTIFAIIFFTALSLFVFLIAILCHVADEQQQQKKTRKNSDFTTPNVLLVLVRSHSGKVHPIHLWRSIMCSNLIQWRLVNHQTLCHVTCFIWPHESILFGAPSK